MKKLFKLSLICAVVMSFIFVLPTNRVMAEEATTYMADVKIEENTRKAVVTFSHVGTINQDKISSWIDDGWSVTGNVATKTFDKNTTFAFLEYSIENEEGSKITEMATIALPYEIDLSGNTNPGVSSRAVNPTINDTSIAELYQENNGTFIKPKKVGETTMTGKIAVGQDKKELNFEWKIKVIDSKGGNTPGDNEENKPGDNEENKPGDNEEDKPGDNEENKPGDNEENKPGDNEGNKPGDNEEDKPGNNGGNTPDNDDGNKSNNNNEDKPANNGESGKENKKDATIAPKRISNTGESQFIIVIAMIVLAIAVTAFVRNKKNKLK